jgi:hypothetical protein
VIVTLVPPAAEPVFGDTAFTVDGGGGASYVYWSALVRALVPPIVVTAMSRVSAVSPARMYTLSDVLLSTLKLVVFSPIDTLLVVLRSVPLTVTQLPPASGPLFGLTPVMVGGAMKVNWSVLLLALVPPALVTVTSTVASAGTAGETAVIVVLLVTAKLLAVVEPKLTAVTPVKPVPLIVIEVPPDVGPLVVEIPVRRGTGTKPGARTR